MYLRVAINNKPIEWQVDETVSDIKPKGKILERTCAACGKKGVKNEFLRFVYAPDIGVICDVRKSINSRGVYFCISKICILKGIKRRAFSRFLHCENSNEPEWELLKYSIENGYKQYVYSIMNMAIKSKKVNAGDSAVSDAFSKGRVRLLLIADDAGKSIGKKFLSISHKQGIPVIKIEEKNKMATKLGIKTTSVFAVVDNQFAAGLNKVLSVLSEVKLW